MLRASLSLWITHVDLKDYSRRTRQFHQHTIRMFYGFRVFDPEAADLLLGEIDGMVRSQLKPKVIFWRCVDVLVREKVEVPSYTRLTKLILGAINRRSQELAAIIERTLTQDVRAVLDNLLTQEPVEGTAVPGKTSAHKLTLMKKLSQSTKPSKVKERVADLDLVRGLYHQLGPALQALALQPGGILYYAYSVIRSEIFQLIRRDDPDRYLHVIAFIAHQFYRLQDNLVDVLLASLRSFQNGAIREHKEQCYCPPRATQRSAEGSARRALSEGWWGHWPPLAAITENRALSDAEKVTRIRALLANARNPASTRE